MKTALLATFAIVLGFSSSNAQEAKPDSSKGDFSIPALVEKQTVRDARPNISLTLVCQRRASEPSGRIRYPQAVAEITEQELKEGWVVTGGGCTQIFPDHNFAYIADMPRGQDGWMCRTGDLPGNGQVVQVQAFLVACRLESR